MSVDVSSPGPWLNIGADSIRDRFVAHMRKSAFPESFDGVVQGIAPPEDSEIAIIIKNISIDPTKRGGALAPCNICGAHPKWKRDGMLILVNGWLYIIGPICGAKHYGERFRREEARFDRERAELTALGFLITNAAKIVRLRLAVEAIRPHAEAAIAAHSQLLKTTKAFAQLRRAATTQAGWLQLDEKHYVQDEHGKRVPKWQRINFTQIQGRAALRTKCNIIDRLDFVLKTLDSFGSNYETALDRIDKAMTQEELPELAGQVRQAHNTLNQIVEEIQEFQTFFSKRNFQNIGAWAAHRGCPFVLTVECYHNWRALTAKNARRRIPIDVTELMSPLPELTKPIQLDDAA